MSETAPTPAPDSPGKSAAVPPRGAAPTGEEPTLLAAVQRPSPEWPARAPKAAPKPKRRRGPWFGAGVTLGVLLALPLLLYLGLWAYLALGFLKSDIEKQVKDRLGPGARLTSVSTHGTERLRIQGLMVPDSGGGEKDALAIGALQFDWDLLALAGDKHIRALTIEQPELRLRRSASGQWNLAWPTGGHSSYRIERVLVRDGSFSVEWAPGRRFALQGVKLTAIAPGLELPSPLSVRALLPSGKTLRIEALLGPDADFSGKLRAALDLKRDLGEALPKSWGLSGRVGVELDVHREAPPTPPAASTAKDAGRSLGDLVLDGAFSLDNFRGLFRPGLEGVLSQRELEVRGRLAWPAEPALRSTAGEVKLRMSGLGQLRGKLKAEWGARPFLRLEAAKARLDLGAFRSAFQPPLAGRELRTEGTVELKELNVSLPLSADRSAFRVSAAASARGVRVSLPGVGGLPPMDVQARFDYGAGHAKIPSAQLAMGSIGQLALSSDASWGKGESDLLEILKQVRVKSLALDLGRFLNTPFGRGLLRRRLAGLDPNNPGKLPFLLSGKLAAADLRVRAKASGPRTLLSLNGIQASGLEILRWPYPVRVPSGTFSGQVKLEAERTGTRWKSVKLSGTVRSAAEPPVQAEGELVAGVDEQGRLRLRRVILPSARVPLAELARWAGLHVPWLNWSGQVEVRLGSYDLESHEGAFLLHLDGLGVAPFNLLGLRDVQGRAEVKFDGRKLLVKGRLESARITSPLNFKPSTPLAYLFQKDRVLPPTDFTFRSEVKAGAGARQLSLELRWPKGGQFKVQGQYEALGRMAWKVTGRAATSLLGGVDGEFDIQADLGRQRLGPLKLTVHNLRLEKLYGKAPEKGPPPNWSLKGLAKELTLKLNPVALKIEQLVALETGFKAELSGRFQDVAVTHRPTNSTAEHLEGTLKKLNITREEGGAAWLVDGAVWLRNYEALFRDTYYLPPPKPNRKTWLRLAARLAHKEGQPLTVRLDKFECDLERLASLKASGTLRVGEDGDPWGKGEGEVSLDARLPDLQSAYAELGLPNLRYRYPSWARKNISGALSWNGRYRWGPRAEALQGRLNFRNAALVSIGASRWSLRRLNGDLPLAFHKGLWPAAWPREKKGTLIVGAAEWPPFQVPQTPLGVIAVPNILSLANEIPVAIPRGKVNITGLRVLDLLAREPKLSFGVNVLNCNLGDLARAEGIRLRGLEETVLKGRLPRCELLRTAGPLGSWALSTTGELGASFFRGRLRMGGFHARGLFSDAPVWGGWLRIEQMLLDRFTRLNPQFGRLRTSANISLTGFTSTGLRLEDVQAFKFRMAGRPRGGDEAYYDGKLALLIAPKKTEAARIKYGLSREKLANMRFLFTRMGASFELKNGTLYGPKSNRSDGLIVKGKGLGSPNIEEPSRPRMAWTRFLAKLRAHEALVKTLPQEKEGGP